MGLLDSLTTQAAGAALGGTRPSAATPDAGAGLDPQMLIGLLSQVLGQAGGLSGILAKLQQGGLADAAASWVGTGANQPVSADALGKALGPDLMGMITGALGTSQQQASSTMADLLPDVIDRLTPQGQLPQDDGLGALGALLGGSRSSGAGLDAGDLAGMLGGLLGKR